MMCLHETKNGKETILSRFVINQLLIGIIILVLHL